MKGGSRSGERRADNFDVVLAENLLEAARLREGLFKAAWQEHHQGPRGLFADPEERVRDGPRKKDERPGWGTESLVAADEVDAPAAERVQPMSPWHYETPLVLVSARRR